MNVEGLIRENYRSVRQELYRNHIPAEQITNVIMLMALEDELLEYSEKEELKNGYSREKRDKATYGIVSDGRIYGVNNFRAMGACREDILESDSNSCILVHRFGSRLDFGLVNKLGNRQSRTGGEEFVKRKYQRIPFKAQINLYFPE